MADLESNSLPRESMGERIRDAIKDFGIPRFIILGFLVLLIVAAKVFDFPCPSF
jgi:hypothetical protein